ncbi:MAG: winged helix-turn-helix domain-containing protein [Pyrinomonadaceae bacterium]
MDDSSADIMYEFGSFRADIVKRRLYCGGDLLPLSSKAFDTLTVLLKNSGKTLTREMLIEAVWDDTVVEGNNLNQQISTLRKTFGEHKFIVTIPGKGYSFVVPVRRSSFAEVGEKPRVSRSRVFAHAFDIDHGRRTGFTIAVLYIFAFCSPFFVSAVRNTASGKQLQSLAVLQFRAERGDEFIGQGISETLRARLGSVADLTVRPGSAAINDVDVMTAGRELNVDSVVTGSVQRADNRIRVTVEMVDIDDARIVWAKTFDDDAANIFELQDSIVGEVASVLRVRLTSSIRSLSIGAIRTYAS